MMQSQLVRTLIVDDEAPARRLLESLLGAWPRLEIVGEAEDGDEAVAAIQDLRPDLVFLDVQMPGRSGLDVAAALEADRLPLIVFVTAYDRYALQAFEVSACDYLVKPFDELRLGRAVERALLWHDRPSRVQLNSMHSRLHELRGPSVQQLVVRIDGRHVFLNPTDIDWIEVADKELHIHSGKNTLVTREPLARLETRLVPELFVRVHRSVVVNRTRIREMQPWFRGDFVIVLVDGTRIVTGRHYRERARQLIASS